VRRLALSLAVLVALAVGLVLLGMQEIGPIVITREGEQKIILRLGAPRDEATRPGVALRFPFLDEVRRFDARWLHLSSQPKEIQTQDRERIVVDNYVIWRIADPLLFYTSFPTGLSEAEAQIDREVRGNVREVIGQHTLPQVLHEARVAIMDDITRKSDEALRRVGVEVADVRLNRTELPAGTADNVYARMRAERERLARKYRAEGEEEARRIRAQADREARVIVAEARRDAEAQRGQGDAEPTRIYAEAYGADPGFYTFIRGLEAYRKTIGGDTTLVVAPDHEFFRLLGGGAAGDGAAPPAP
jgi:membrane protease subunit HflC